MFRKLIVAAVVVLLCREPARAQLDPEPKQPYLWRVVVSVKPHPLLTPDFRERLKRDVLAALQPKLKALGTVEVIDLADPARDREPLVQQFEATGFAALDAPRDLTGAKTHFLKVEYRDGKIHLEARQYDGFTGLASPLVRKQSVRAQELTGRTAGLMLDRDFGLVGTVEPVLGKPDEARVLVRGAGLGAVKELVRVGDVFAVAAVRKTNRPAPPPLRTATGKIIAPPPGSVPPPGLTATPRDFTLLKVVEVGADGNCRCAVLTRYQTALPLSSGIIGYRAMKLGTVTAPVAVRLVSTEGVVYKTASAVNVRASDSAFALAGDPKDVCTFDNATSQFRSQKPLANVACITVALGPSQAKQFPVPILSADPLTIPFDTDPVKEERAAFERSVLTAAGAAADARIAQSVCFEEVGNLIKKQKNADALARARGGFDAADAADKQLSDELARLKEQATHVQKAENVDAILAKMEQNLAALRAYNAQLAEHTKQIAKVVARENDPNVAAKEVAAERINAQIAVLLSRGDVDEALAAYDQLFALLPGDADVKARKDKLAVEWKAKGDGHQKARDYLLKTWPGVQTVADFRDSYPLLRAAVDECKKHNDTWTMRKLLTIFETALKKLNEQVAQLDTTSEADKKLLSDANEVGKKMGALEVEVRKLAGG